MQNTELKVLICDNSAVNGTRIAAALVEAGMYAVTRKCTPDVVISSILSDRPDVVVCSLTMEGSDAIEMISKANSLLPNSPDFIVTSDVYNSFMERQILASGAAYFLASPFEPEKLIEIIRMIAYKKNDSSCKDEELMVTELIRMLGIPAHIKGYRYIRAAILECLRNRSRLDSFTKELYPAVAEQYGTTPARVERAIRHAIDSAWSKGDSETFSSFFGYSVNMNSCRPTNSEFIALATDKLMLRLK